MSFHVQSYFIAAQECMDETVRPNFPLSFLSLLRHHNVSFVIARPKKNNQKVLKFQINRVCTLFSYFVIPGHYFLDMAKQNRNSQ